MNQDPLAVLLVEDGPTDALLVESGLERELAGRMALRRVDRLAGALEALAAGAYDVVLLDLGLPDSQGIDTFRALRAAAARTPVVVVTGSDDAEIATAALQGGAQDYVVKGPDIGRDLARSIRYAIERTGVLDRLRRTEARLGLLVASVEDYAIVTLDAQGRIETWNEGAERVTGYAAAAMLGSPYPDRDRLLDAALRGKAESEGWRLRMDGGRYWASVVLSALREEDGELVGYAEVTRDLTERKRAEDELAARARRAALVAELSLEQTRADSLASAMATCMAAIVDRMQMVCARVWLLERGSGDLVLAAASGACRATDRMKERIALGVGELGRIASERAPRLLPGCCSTWHDAANVPWCSVQVASVHPLLVGDELLGLLAIESSAPIDDQVASACTAIASNLALGVKRRQDELRQAELQQRYLQSQKMEAIGQLAGGVAHDFNNLLTVILGCAHDALDALGPGHPLRPDLEEIRRAGERAAALTRQLLAFGRKQRLEIRAFDLDAAVRETEKMLRRLIGENIELALELGCAPRAALADPAQVAQVIMNLAVNARDAMPGGGRLTIRTEDAPGGGPDGRPARAVRLEVRDEGIGMDAEIRAHLFEPFYTTKDHGKGTGLGLATVYGIVEQCGGAIQVESEPGRGTTFRIWLPAGDVAAGAPPPATAEERAAARDGRRILLVEDEPSLRALAARILRSAGHAVVEAGDPDEAIARLEGEGGRVDLLVTDLLMPGGNGRQLAARLRSARSRLPVLYISGYSEDLLGERALGQDEAFLAKPFSPQTLLRHVQERLARPAGPAGGGAERIGE